MSFWVTEYWNIKKTKWWNYTSMYKSRKPSSSIFKMEQKYKKLWTVFLIQLKIDTTIIIVYITLILVAVVTYGFCTFLAFWLSFPTFLNNNTKKIKYNFRSHLILNKLSKLGKCQLASKSPMCTVLFWLVSFLFKHFLTVTSKRQTYIPETKHWEPFTYKNWDWCITVQ